MKHALAVAALTTIPTFARAEGDAGSAIVPIVVVAIVFGCAALIVATLAYAAHRGRRLRHETIRLALEKGQSIPSELLGDRGNGGRGDLRRGIILLFAGAGIALYFSVAPPPGTEGQWAAGFVPAALGLAFVVNHVIGRRHGPQQPRDDR